MYKLSRISSLLRPIAFKSSPLQASYSLPAPQVNPDIQYTGVSISILIDEFE